MLTLTVLLAALMIVPLSLQEPDITVLNRIADAFPGVAGGHFLAGDTDPYPAAVGLLLLAGWAGRRAGAGPGRAAPPRRLSGASGGWSAPLGGTSPASYARIAACTRLRTSSRVKMLVR